MNSKEIAIKFYDAFSVANIDVLKQLYDKKLIFNDNIFVNLDYNETISMWSSLLVGNKNMSIKYEIKKYSEKYVEVEWIADYLFTSTNRNVKNIILAKMEIDQGKIINHKDNFDFYKWSQMAFGITGVLIGWTSFFKNKVRTEAYNKLGLQK